MVNVVIDVVVVVGVIAIVVVDVILNGDRIVFVIVVIVVVVVIVYIGILLFEVYTFIICGLTCLSSFSMYCVSGSVLGCLTFILMCV